MRHSAAALHLEAAAQAEDDPRRWYSTNLVGVPVGLLVSTAFNAHPLPLTIGGTRMEHRGLFRLLEAAEDIEAASAVFRHYMELAFDLKPPPPEERAARHRHRFRSSYLKLLQGWGLDSNSQAGAVLKGWVESRFGVVPTYHKQALGRFPSESWMAYVEEKASSRFHNNCINSQLDLLYEYCQWAIGRFRLAVEPWVTLWRGVNSFDEQVVVGGSHRSGQCVVRLNNVVSFTTQRERADEFGDWILKARVPAVKLVFFPGILPGAPLTGEDEALVIGGDYNVEASYA